MTRSGDRRDAPPEVRTRRGAHRAGPEPMRVLVPALVLAVVVGGGVAALTGGDEPGDSASAATRLVDAAPPADRPTPTTAPPSAAPDTSTPEPSAEATARPSASENPDEPDEPDTSDEVGVVVLNQTGISGLAARVGSDLAEAGWTVTGTGNFRGRVPSTTVYYPDGMRSEAEEVAADLPGPDRVRPVFGNLSRSRLTVVLTQALR